MPEYDIAGVAVNFPFEPYDVQKDYMEKVITCLKNGTNGVLESPTGTGKTLSLLCSSLAWLLTRKAEAQLMAQKLNLQLKKTSQDFDTDLALNAGSTAGSWGIPKIIYASRTHSQLTQAMQELKRTSYGFLRAVVLGSRDQLCIHPDVMKEIGNSNKTQMCKLRVQNKACTFHMRVDSRKDHPDVRGPTILDIEDLVKVGQKLKVCPYYISKELVPDADITFMPYNYLLDPKARKANNINLNNAVVILDEAHNIEKICEESASVQIRSSDIAMAIDDITHVMKSFDSTDGQDYSDDPKDFTLEDLVLLKEMLLELEKAIDDIVVDFKAEGATFPPAYLFEILEKANFNSRSANGAIALIEKLIQYLAVQTQNTAFRKGGSFQTLADFLAVVYINKEELVAKIHKSFKLHVQIEETKQQNTRGGTSKDGWLSKSTTTTTSSTKKPKILNYWCFNPGFGMEQLLNTQARSIILTSGTLAPLKPLIAELAIPVAERLENPHIVSSSQVYVKIIGAGPDREPLISNYQNRDNPKYISSLGQTVLNVSRLVPDGLLVFFPSYPLLNQCVNSWQAGGLWSDISRHKPIFVEPRRKEEFTNTMEEFYQNIRDLKGACFMAVCRGKVSEGLDFADRNGRAVIITGLPFPPLKDPKVILKKRYLDDNRTKENELLSGQEWYGLDATRAVNQAIGRVIRHRHDYGAILLCDARFQYPSQVQQLSKWLRAYLGTSPKASPFGSIVRELRQFFKNAEGTMPEPKERNIETLVQTSCDEVGITRSPLFADPKKVLESKNSFRTAHSMAIKVEKTNSIESWSPADYTAAAGRSQHSKTPSAMDFMSRLDTDVAAIDFNNTSTSCSSTTNIKIEPGLVNIHKRERKPIASTWLNTSPSSSSSGNGNESNNSEGSKRKRFKLISNTQTSAALINQFAFDNKPKLQNAVDTPNVSENRRDLLKVLQTSLSKEDFSSFKAALFSYKSENTLNELLDLYENIFGTPNLKHLLVDLRRLLKNDEHKNLFDKRFLKML